MNEIYDIYLIKGCDARPKLGNLARQYPSLSEAAFLERIILATPGGPGLLGLKLPKSTAVELIGILKTQRANGYVINAAYRNPKISIKEALPIAERAARALQQERFSSYSFDPLRFKGEEPTYWRFAAVSKQMQDEGYFPGALFVDVDKLDGHVWQKEEYARLHKSE